MVRNGMTPWQVIVAATRSFAEAVGASDRVGTIETGKWADLIAVRDNPLDDIRNLRHPSLVLRGGAFAVNAFANLPIGVA
jgi:imidazolonepropionase-like amidohydrolase